MEKLFFTFDFGTYEANLFFCYMGMYSLAQLGLQKKNLKSFIIFQR